MHTKAQSKYQHMKWPHIDGLVQDCDNSSANEVTAVLH